MPPTTPHPPLPGATTVQDVPTTLGRVRVHVTGDPGAPAMLLWPALLMDHSLWDEQVSHFSDRFLTIAVDPPGHGASEPVRGPVTLEQCAATVVDVLDALGIDRAHVLGNSWGAMTGGAFAALHPDRVGCSVLMNGSSSTAPLRQRVEFRALTRLALLAGGFTPLLPLVTRSFLGPTSRRSREWAVERVQSLARRNDPESIAHVARDIVIRRTDQRELLGRIDSPVLVIAGVEDPTFPFGEVTQMASAIPGAVQVTAYDAGHLVGLEVPEWVNAHIDTFLARSG